MTKHHETRHRSSAGLVQSTSHTALWYPVHSCGVMGSRNSAIAAPQKCLPTLLPRPACRRAAWNSAATAVIPLGIIGSLPSSACPSRRGQLSEIGSEKLSFWLAVPLNSLKGRSRPINRPLPRILRCQSPVVSAAVLRFAVRTLRQTRVAKTVLRTRVGTSGAAGR